MSSNKVFSKEEWKGALEELREFYRLFVPVKEGDFHNFRPMEGEVRANFAFTNTRLSPKSVIFPQSDRMFVYGLDENDPEAHILREAPKDLSPQAVVGIRPCDALAIRLVKVNFDNPQYRDPWWVQRFEATTLVGMGCNAPCSTCFCTSVGSGPFSENGLDVLLFDLGDRFLARTLSKKGEDLLAKTRGGSEAGEEVEREAEAVAASGTGKISSSIATDKLKEKVVTRLFDAPFWEEVAFGCINCATCTYLCPTCWCFDIQDEVMANEGLRMRNWDACMFPLFTLHGSGHNPRENKLQRVRQRFMHKLKYYVDKYHNGVACVGCGRCVQFCPANIDIRRVAQLMNDF